jgi:hypothetical protein
MKLYALALLATVAAGGDLAGAVDGSVELGGG